jgi:hypothetical protein
VQVVIGIRGNGLTHMLWMPPNSTVIEVRCLVRLMAGALIWRDRYSPPTVSYVAIKLWQKL